MQASSFSTSDINKLGDFINDGNGLVVFGGDNSFEYGKYQDSQLLSLLPVTIGQGEKQPRPDLNAVVVIDASYMYEPRLESVPLAKSHAINLMSQFRVNDNVGVVAFAEQYYTLSAINKMTIDHSADINDKITRLKPVPEETCTNPRVCSNEIAGLTGAYQLLEGTSGKKWAFLYSDGCFADYSYGMSPRLIEKLIDDYKKQNIVLYTTMTLRPKIGDVTIYPFAVTGCENSLRKLAEGTGGIYFPPSDSERMKLVFGKQTDIQEEENGGLKSIMTLNRYHFITEDFEPTAKITGYNQIVPKANGKLLMTTSMGDPLLVVWRFGVGRVVTFGTDDGTAWAGQVLNKDNSKLISRMLNWAIGDPERKLEVYTQVPDGIINETNEVTVKSTKYPKSEGLSFYKVDDDIYTAKFKADKMGFNQIAGNTYASNYKLEYETLSLNSQLDEIVSATDGKIFKPTDAKEILDFVSKRSERIDVQKNKVSWPFVVIALLIFLIEVLIRRVEEQLRKAD